MTFCVALVGASVRVQPYVTLPNKRVHNAYVVIWHTKRFPCNGPLARYVKLRIAHAPGIPGTLFPPPRVRDPDMHRGRCVTHLPWCMPGSLTSGFLWSLWRGKRSLHSWHMRNPQLYVSSKRTMKGMPNIFSFDHSDGNVVITHLLMPKWESCGTNTQLRTSRIRQWI